MADKMFNLTDAKGVAESFADIRNKAIEHLKKADSIDDLLFCASALSAYAITARAMKDADDINDFIKNVQEEARAYREKSFDVLTKITATQIVANIPGGK